MNRIKKLKEFIMLSAFIMILGVIPAKAEETISEEVPIESEYAVNEDASMKEKNDVNEELPEEAENNAVIETFSIKAEALKIDRAPLRLGIYDFEKLPQTVYNEWMNVIHSMFVEGQDLDRDKAPESCRIYPELNQKHEKGFSYTLFRFPELKPVRVTEEKDGKEVIMEYRVSIWKRYMSEDDRYSCPQLKQLGVDTSYIPYEDVDFPPDASFMLVEDEDPNFKAYWVKQEVVEEPNPQSPPPHTHTVIEPLPTIDNTKVPTPIKTVEIEEDNTPLAQMPEDEPVILDEFEEEPMILDEFEEEPVPTEEAEIDEILTEDIPLSAIPKTGDSQFYSNIKTQMIWAVMGLIGMLLTASALKNKKNDNH